MFCDDLHSRAVAAAHAQAHLPVELNIHRAYSISAFEPLQPSLLLGRKVAQRLQRLMNLIASAAYCHRFAASKHRKKRPNPHESMTQSYSSVLSRAGLI